MGHQFKLFSGFVLAASMLTTVSPASATVIDFNSLGGVNGDLFTSYAEGGFTVSSSVGRWNVGKDFGNPVPDLFSSNAITSEGYGLNVDAGGLNFTFTGLDHSPNQGAQTYTFTGFLNGVEQYQYTGTTANDYFHFYTLTNGYASTAIDHLELLFSEYSNVDNINVALSSTPSTVPVPEPSSLALLSLGLFGLALRKCKK